MYAVPKTFVRCTHCIYFLTFSLSVVSFDKLTLCIFSYKVIAPCGLLRKSVHSPGMMN